MASKKEITIDLNVGNALANIGRVNDALKNLNNPSEKLKNALIAATSEAAKSMKLAGEDMNKVLKIIDNFSLKAAKAIEVETSKKMNVIKREIDGIIKKAEDFTTMQNVLGRSMSNITSAAVGDNLYSKVAVEEIKSFVAETKRANESVNLLDNSTKKMDTSLISSTAKLSPLNTTVRETGDEIERANQKIRLLEQQFKSIGASTLSASDKATQFRDILYKISRIRMEANAFDSTLKSMDKYAANIAGIKNALEQERSALSKTQSTIKNLEADYNKMGTTLNNLENKYKKLQESMSNAIGRTGSKAPVNYVKNINELQKNISEYQKSMNVAGKEVDTLRKKEEQQMLIVKQLEDAYERLNKTMQHQEGLLPSLTTKNNALKASTNALEENIRSNIALQNAYSKTHGTLRLVGSQFRSFIYDVNAVRIAFILLASSSGIGFFIRTLADFDKSMARARALMQGTGEETASLRVQFEALRNTVRDLGATTKFTAGEVGEASVILAQAGLDSAESINSLKPVLDLAVAGNLEMAKSADVVVKTLQMFNLETEDASRVADVYAMAANLSATNVEKMSTSMVYAGAVANNFGLSVEETAGMLGVLANSGIEASIAGTSLRRIMVDLMKPTKDSQKVLDAYGISLSALRKEGLSSIQILQRVISTIGATPDAGRVFRVTALPSVQSLANNIGELEEFIDALENAEGYSEKLAEINMDNLKDQFIQLKSAVEDFIIRFGDATGLTDGLTSALAESAVAIRGWNKDISSLLINLAGGAATLTTLLVLLKRVPSIRKIDGKEVVVQISNTERLTKAFLDNAKGLTLWQRIGNSLGGTFTVIGTGLKNITKLAVGFGIQAAAITAVFWGITKLIERFNSEANFDEVTKKYSDFAKVVTGQSDGIAQAMRAVRAEAEQMSLPILNATINQMEEDLETLKRGAKEQLSDIIKDLESRKLGLQNLLDVEDYIGLKDETIAEVQADIKKIDDKINLLAPLKDSVKDEDIAEVNATFQSLDLIENFGLKKSGELKKKFQEITDSIVGAQEKTGIYKDVAKNSKEQIEKLVDVYPLLSNFMGLFTFGRSTVEQFGEAMTDIARETDTFARNIPDEKVAHFINELEKLNPGIYDFMEYIPESRQLIVSPDVMASYEELKQKLKEVSSNFRFLPENARLIAAITQQLKNVAQSIGTVVSANDELNANFILGTAAKLHGEATVIRRIDNIAEHIKVASDLSKSMAKNFINAIGADQMEVAIKLLGNPIIELGKTLEETTLNGEKFTVAIDNIKASLQTSLFFGERKHEVEEIKKIIQYLEDLEVKVKSFYEKQDSKKKRRRDLDFELEYLRTAVAIDKATYSLSAYHERLLSVRQIQVRINKLEEERAEKGNMPYFQKLIDALKEQQKIQESIGVAKEKYESTAVTNKYLSSLSQAYEVESSLAKMAENIRKEKELTYTIQAAIENGVGKDQIQSMNEELVKQTTINDILLERGVLLQRVSVLQQAMETYSTGNHGYFAALNTYEMEKQVFALREQMAQQQIDYLEIQNNAIAADATLSEQQKADLMAQNSLTMQRIQLETELARIQMENNNPSGFQGLKNSIHELADSVAKDADIIKDAMTDAFSTIEDGLTENLHSALESGKTDWSNFFSSLAETFYRAVIRMIAIRAMAKGLEFLTGFLGGLGQSAGAASFSSSGSMGNIFASSSGASSNGMGWGVGLFPNASGGIINRATAFPSKRGHELAGEAGPEALMPLKRLPNGKLGVYSEGGNNSGAVVNENNFSFQINMEGSSGDKQKDEEYAREVAKQVRDVVKVEISEWAKNQSRDGGFLSGMKRK